MIKQLASVKDKQVANVIVKHSTQIAYTPVKIGRAHV